MHNSRSAGQSYRLVPASDPVGHHQQPQSDPAQAPPTAPLLATPPAPPLAPPPDYVVREYPETLKPPAQIPTPPPARPQPQKAVSRAEIAELISAFRDLNIVTTQEQTITKQIVIGNSKHIKELRNTVSNSNCCTFFLVVPLLIITLIILIYSVFWRRRHDYLR